MALDLQAWAANSPGSVVEPEETETFGSYPAEMFTPQPATPQPAPFTQGALNPGSGADYSTVNLAPTTTTRLPPPRSRVASSPIPLTPAPSGNLSSDMVLDEVPADAYDTWAQNNPIPAADVSRDAFNSYMETYGNLPNWHQTPEGDAMFNRTTAEALGAPYRGTYLSQMGTGNDAGSAYVPAELQAAMGDKGPYAQRAEIADYYQNMGIADAMTAGGGGDPGFMDWFTNQGPRMGGDLGADFLGNVMGVPEPRIYGDGSQAYMPGLFGKSYNTAQFTPGTPQYNPAAALHLPGGDQLPAAVQPDLHAGVLGLLRQRSRGGGGSLHRKPQPQ